MGRKSTKRARYDAMSQRGQKRYDKAKLFTKRDDAKDWTDKVLTKIKAGEEE